jgi:hypothetical protein
MTKVAKSLVLRPGSMDTGILRCMRMTLYALGWFPGPISNAMSMLASIRERGLDCAREADE